MHHPLYTSGRYRNTARIHRWLLEPTLVKHGVDAFFSGHEHIYQRSALESGVQYFISGGAGSLRAGDGALASYIARTYDDDYHFMLVEIDDEALYFQAISRTGRTIDAGVLYEHGDAARRGDAYVGHDGPSLISRTFALNTRIHSAIGRTLLNSLRLRSNRAPEKRSFSCASVSRDSSRPRC